MTCIKTGAVVHFPEYGVTVAADLYAVDGVTIVRFLPSQWDCDNCQIGRAHV